MLHPIMQLPIPSQLTPHAARPAHSGWGPRKVLAPTHTQLRLHTHKTPKPLDGYSHLSELHGTFILPLPPLQPAELIRLWL